jgi:hypothetical protein
MVVFDVNERIHAELIYKHVLLIAIYWFGPMPLSVFELSSTQKIDDSLF